MAIKRKFAKKSGARPLTEVLTKQKIVKALSIGFEWEIPYFRGEGDTIRKNLKPYLSKGFRYHYECGCLEMVSPKALTLPTIRSIAKELKCSVVKGKGLDWEQSQENTDGGIHVHIGFPNLGYSTKYKLYRRISASLTKRKNQPFIKEFSKRQPEKFYTRQIDFSSGCRGMLKYNDYGTIEYRFFRNLPELLVPGIEFAHSFTKFCMVKRKDYSLVSYKECLFKRKGYKELKSYAPWELLK